MSKIGKRLKLAKKYIDKKKYYSLLEAFNILKKDIKQLSFNESIDVAFNLNINSRHTDQIIRGFCVLPYNKNDKVRVAVFAKGKKAEEAKSNFADKVGAEDLLKEINSSKKINFDVILSTPDMMSIVSRLGKKLGPRNLMPNTKNNTLTLDISQAIKDAKNGAIYFKSDKYGILHSSIGKLSFTYEQLQSNFSVIMNSIIKYKPNVIKGKYINNVYLSSTMGPGFKLKI